MSGNFLARRPLALPRDWALGCQPRTGWIACTSRRHLTAQVRLESVGERPHGAKRCRRPSSRAPAAVSGSLASESEAQHVQRQAPFVADRELDQSPLTAHVAIDPGAAGQRQVLGGRTWDGRELGGDVAARQPEYGAAVGQGFRVLADAPDEHAASLGTSMRILTSSDADA